MGIRELTKDELTEVKQVYYGCLINEREHRDLSFKEYADINSIVSDEEIFEAYGHINFTEEDFFCNIRKEA